jgi:hypothetical protein
MTKSRRALLHSNRWTGASSYRKVDPSKPGQITARFYCLLLGCVQKCVALRTPTPFGVRATQNATHFGLRAALQRNLAYRAHLRKRDTSPTLAAGYSASRVSKVRISDLSAFEGRCKSLDAHCLQNRAEGAQSLTGLLCAPSRKHGEFGRRQLLPFFAPDTWVF